MTLEEAVKFCEDHECNECPVYINNIETRTKSAKMNGELCCINLLGINLDD